MTLGKVMKFLKDSKLFIFDLFDTTVRETVHHNPYKKIIRASGISDRATLQKCLTEDMTITELLKLFNVSDKFCLQEISRQLNEEYM